MPFVLRNEEGRIVGKFETPQPFETEFLDDDDPEMLAYPYTPAEVLPARKAELIAQVNAHAESLFAQLISSYPPSESLTWPYKLEEAQAFLSTGNELLADNLRVEAKSRQIPLQAFAQTVVNKSLQYRAKCAQISGARGRHTDAIAQLETLEELQAYDWMSGWD